jgi:hypothetical protein
MARSEVAPVRRRAMSGITTAPPQLFGLEEGRKRPLPTVQVQVVQVPSHNTRLRFERDQESRYISTSTSR